MDPLKTYRYLVQSRERVFEAVRPITAEQYHRAHRIGLKTIGATITHIMISEWYYIQRLTGQVVPPYDQWPIKYERPPAFRVVETTWKSQATATLAAIAAERDWNRRITWLSFPNEQGQRYHITATAGDFLTQLVLHEVHHRAQVMAMLREIGHPLEDLDYNALMFERRAVEL